MTSKPLWHRSADATLLNVWRSRLRDEMAMECLDHVLDFLEACGKATAVGTLGFFEGSFDVLPVSIEPEHYPVQHLLIACCILLLPDLFSINLDRQIPIFGVDSASEGLAQYRSIFSQGSWMPQIQPWIDERKWKRRPWWLWGHRHGRLQHRKSFFWLRVWLSDFPWSFRRSLLLIFQPHTVSRSVGARAFDWFFWSPCAMTRNGCQCDMRSTLQKTYSHMTYSGTYTCTSTDFYFYKSPQKRRRASLLFFSCILRIWLKEILQNNYELKCLGWDQKASLLVIPCSINKLLTCLSL